jgi:hypothetical protein
LWRFFYTGPDRSFPFCDGRVIALHGPTFWLLVAPAYLVQEFAHVIAMVSHSQSAFNQIGNSLGGPQLCPVSVGHGSLDQETNKLFLLFRGQSRGPTRCWLGFQCLWPTGLQGIAPTHNTTCMASHASGNLMEGKLLLQERSHTAPTLIQQFRRSFRSHGDTPG